MPGPAARVLSDKVSLSGHEIHEALDLASGFHDALLETSRIEADMWILEIRHVYFPDLRRYDAFGTDGCLLRLAGCDPPAEVPFNPDRSFLEWRSNPP
mgnify:CR=1 FL=1